MHILADSFWVSAAFGGIGGAAIAAAIGIPLSWWLKWTSDRDLESHKAALFAANAKELEHLRASLKIDAEAEADKLRNKLRLDAFAHEIRFQSLHAKQADVMARISGLITTSLEAHMAYLASLQVGKIDIADITSLFKVAEDAELSTLRYLFEHQIYIKQDLADVVAQVSSDIGDIRTRISQQMKLLSGDVSIDQIRNVARASLEQIDKLIKPSVAILHDRFRAIIGV